MTITLTRQDYKAKPYWHAQIIWRMGRSSERSFDTLTEALAWVGEKCASA